MSPGSLRSLGRMSGNSCCLRSRTVSRIRRRGLTSCSSEFRSRLSCLFRAQIWERSFFGPDGRNTLTHRDMIKIYGSVVQEVKDEMKRQGREDEFIGSRVFYRSRSICALHLLIVDFTPEDHLYHHQGHHATGTRVVHGRLSGSQEGVPRFDRRFVSYSARTARRDSN